MTARERLSDLVARLGRAMDRRPSAVSAAPRLLLVDNQVDDFSRYRLSLAVALREVGFDVHVALPSEKGLEPIRRAGMTVHVIYMRRKSMNPLDELRCLWSLLVLYRRVRPAVVHHLCLKPALYGGIAARLTDVPLVLTTFPGLGYLFATQTVRIRFLRRFVRACLRYGFRPANRLVILQNGSDRDRLIADHVVAADHAILIRGSGVDMSVFTPSAEPDGKPVVLMAARLLWDKGVREFVASARELHRRSVDVRCVLAGEPDPGHPTAIPMEFLQAWADSGAVEWSGWHHDMALLIRRSHIVCLPSAYGEGVPRILVEAAACARPVVATNCPGCREIVRHGENGLLVEVNDVAGLTEALERLLVNSRLRVAMGTRGRKIVADRFSLERVIDATLDAYGSLLATFVDGSPCRA